MPGEGASVESNSRKDVILAQFVSDFKKKLQMFSRDPLLIMMKGAVTDTITQIQHQQWLAYGILK